ncbi:MAG: hypothetical protein LBD53_06575 [Tannerella sp.]|jgi:3-hydroxymyristoyl/3-hydroxydecanoyl-(acyl carrier protein) dehydratase|nr:hypothetical protein [Tannerella sp.]
MITSEDIKTLIPQREPMLMIDKLCKIDYNSADTKFRVRKNCLFVNDYRHLDVEGLLENIAQSAATIVGNNALKENKAVPIGLLGEISKCLFWQMPHVGEVVRTNISIITEALGVMLIQSSSYRKNDVLCASTKMKIAAAHNLCNSICKDDANISSTVCKDNANILPTVCKDFSKIVSFERSDRQAVFDIILLPECDIYRGHFPDFPVAPGVFNLRLLRECVEILAGMPMKFFEICKCRFNAFIKMNAAKRVRLKISYVVVGDAYHLLATLEDFHDNTNYMDFTGILEHDYVAKKKKTI